MHWLRSKVNNKTFYVQFEMKYQRYSNCNNNNNKNVKKLSTFHINIPIECQHIFNHTIAHRRQPCKEWHISHFNVMEYIAQIIFNSIPRFF